MRFPTFIKHVKAGGAEPDVVVRLATFYQLNVCSIFYAVGIWKVTLFQRIRVMFRFLFTVPLLIIAIDCIRVPISIVTNSYGFLGFSKISTDLNFQLCIGFFTYDGWYWLLCVICDYSTRTLVVCSCSVFADLTPRRFFFLVPSHTKLATKRRCIRHKTPGRCLTLILQHV